MIKPNTLSFDVLHNFISPVTGRVLATYKYVLVGDRQGIATPSPILIDIRLDLIALRKRYNTLVKGDIIIGHPNEELPNAQVLVDLADGFLYNTAGVVSTFAIIPIGSLPDLPFNNIWIGDNSNRPVPRQRIGLINLPPLSSLLLVNPVSVPPGAPVNFGIHNIYSASIVLDPTEPIQPSTTLRVDMSNLPNLRKGRIWFGTANYIPPVITIDGTPPYVHVVGSLNWDARSNPISPWDYNAYCVPQETGLNPKEIFIGSTDPSDVGQIVTTTALYIDNLPNLTSTMIWRGDLINRPVESNSLNIIEADITTINGQIATITADLAALTATVAGLSTTVAGLVVTVGTLSTTVAGLVVTVAGLSATVAGLVTTVAILDARKLNEVPAPDGDVDLNNFKIINLADPVDPLDAVNLQTLESYIAAGAVTSVTGTANQITASPTTGAVVLSFPTNVVIPNDLQVTHNLDVTNICTLSGIQVYLNAIGTVTSGVSLNLYGNNTGDVILNDPTYSTGFVGVGGVPAYYFDVFGTSRSSRVLGNGNAPAVTLGSSSVVGTGATSSITGSEVGGVFTLNTGTGALAAGVAVTFTLSSAMPSSSFSVIFTAASTALNADIFVTSTSSSVFTLNINASMVLLASTTYKWNYQIVGY